MHDIWMRIVENLTDRISGPMKFRVLLAANHGCNPGDSCWIERCQSVQNVLLVSHCRSSPSERVDQGWKDVGKVFVLAIVLDIGYQIYVLRFVYPGEAVIVAFVLAIIPYLILRGLVTRIARKKIALRMQTSIAVAAMVDHHKVVSTHNGSLRRLALLRVSYSVILSIKQQLHARAGGTTRD